jgi:flagellar hook-associated protein 1 FlgK
MDDEAAHLQSYEQAYQAASKVFSILNTVMAAAINLGTTTTVA